jgi:hypothetical protein
MVNNIHHLKIILHLPNRDEIGGRVIGGGSLYYFISFVVHMYIKRLKEDFINKL